MASESETVREAFEAYALDKFLSIARSANDGRSYLDNFTESAWLIWQAARSSTPSAEAKDAEPDPALLISMACCLNHGFALLPQRHRDSMLHDMRKLWDETQGRGYYRPENRERYMAMHAAIAQQPKADAYAGFDHADLDAAVDGHADAQRGGDGEG